MAKVLPPEENPQKALKVALEILINLARSDENTLKKSLYDSFSGISFLLLEANKASFKPGWASNLKNIHNNTMFTTDEANTIEGLAKNVELFFNNDEQVADDKQTGGAVPLKPRTSKLGFLREIPKLASSLPFDTDIISFDRTYWKIRNFIKGLDKQAHDISRDFGPFKFFYDSPIDIPVPVPIPFPLVTPPFVTIVTVKIPPRVIPVLIETFVETIRLIFSVGPMSNEVARKVLSIVLTIIDLIKGEWKHSILSFAGYYGQYPLLIGIIGKVYLTIFSFIAPDIQEALLFNAYRSVKSIFIGFYLWIFTVIAPDFIRARVKDAFENPMYLKVIEKVVTKAEKEGFVVDPKDTFVITLDDIQNLQSIARQPAVMCSSEFQKAISLMTAIIPVRLFLEMINIPCDPESVELVCGPYKDLPLETTVSATLGVAPDKPKDNEAATGDKVSTEVATNKSKTAKKKR